ncbi:MAG: SPOR domain-containing protein [Candidatus Pedobacter colombiensis]|uniref:SPOR domain-containing protein n=1 Tax=Candidatus Pedobacter colombiensis TaxID=3121371 RepID=A0AAJ6B6P0_9SPHI|nr:SPOR domain-containing protein [Pedobacter sp.]WEK19054.1 MAG: SPOR domain-containing protein [Pedobacter sp.]
MKKLLTGLLCCFSAVAFAQTKGVVSVVKDPMIDSLIAKRIELNLKSAATSTPGTAGSGRPGTTLVSQMGYRVQIFYGSDRREVFNEQSKFNSSYPELNTYITYKQPNYYLRVGDFRTRLEAQHLMNELRQIFPTLFIFREKINAPNLNYSNDN